MWMALWTLLTGGAAEQPAVCPPTPAPVVRVEECAPPAPVWIPAQYRKRVVEEYVPARFEDVRETYFVPAEYREIEKRIFVPAEYREVQRQEWVPARFENVEVREFVPARYRVEIEKVPAAPLKPLDEPAQGRHRVRPGPQTEAIDRRKREIAEEAAARARGEIRYETREKKVLEPGTGVHVTKVVRRQVPGTGCYRTVCDRVLVAGTNCWKTVCERVLVPGTGCERERWVRRQVPGTGCMVPREIEELVPGTGCYR